MVLTNTPKWYRYRRCMKEHKRALEQGVCHPRSLRHTNPQTEVPIWFGWSGEPMTREPVTTDQPMTRHKLLVQSI